MIQHTKAMYFDDKKVGSQILQISTALECKQLARSIENLTVNSSEKNTVWNRNST